VSTPVFDATLDRFSGTPVFWVILELDLHERFDTLMARFALTEEDETVQLPRFPHIAALFAEGRAAAAHIAGLDHDEFS